MIGNSESIRNQARGRIVCAVDGKIVKRNDRIDQERASSGCGAGAQLESTTGDGFGTRGIQNADIARRTTIGILNGDEGVSADAEIGGEAHVEAGPAAAIMTNRGKVDRAPGNICCARTVVQPRRNV